MRLLARVGIGLWLFLLVHAGANIQSAVAQTAAPSAEEITRALTPQAQPRPQLRSRGAGTRGIEVREPEKPVPPSIDLYINFKYDSADLEADAVIALEALATALKTPQLKDARILIIGHTDATGGDDYNQKLSERRADTVRRFLVSSHGIGTTRLQAMGRGKTQLKDPSRPGDGINRRVEVRNVSEATQ